MREVTEKICKECGLWKDVSEFTISRKRVSKKTGKLILYYYTYCKVCAAKRRTVRYAKDKQTV